MAASGRPSARPGRWSGWCHNQLSSTTGD